MRSIMNHNFSHVPQANIERSSFDRSHGHKTTFDEGYLIPVYLDEALPGDTFNLKMSAFARLATPIKPIMDNMYLDTFFFAVPYRLLWDNWQAFCGEKEDPTDDTDYIMPTMTTMSSMIIDPSTLANYFGLPMTPSDAGTYYPPQQINALPFRAYNLIWNQYFRDQNLQDSVTVNKGNGPDIYSNYYLLKRGKRHDYFTSCLPWPQKGPDVTIPMGDYAPITGLGKANNVFAIGTVGAYESDGVIHTYNHAAAINGSDSNSTFLVEGPGATGSPRIFANLTEGVAGTINALRQAFQLQKLYERDARGGTRYTEIIRSHFGVISPDARLQRPEYLGGGSNPINIHPIAQTSNTGSTGTPQGNLAGFGTVSVNGNGFVKSFTEHCLIMGLVSVRADLTYQTGIDRMWTRKTRFDYYWPALAHIGEQAVLNTEIFHDYSLNDSVTPSSNLNVFGYQERYAEYKYKKSMITGLFASNADDSLDVWHLSQDFATCPVLGPTFIEENPPISRVVAVPSEPHFIFDSYFDLKCARPMPVYSVPGLVDHF